MSPITQVDSFRFTPAELRPSERKPGISAFMRIRDGAFSLEAAIRSHIAHFDEIVAVFNRSTDATPDILGRLAAEFGPRLRVYHYLPPVFPPGSEGHAREPADSPLSLVNYYNLALSLTRFSHATKLDDDHVAMTGPTAHLVADIRAGRAGANEMACFSGLNLARDAEGRVGVLHHEPFSGSGDIGIFPVGPETYFEKDRRFEVMRRTKLPRRFHSIVYWHLKFLKPEFGFANYDLGQNPNSRYARRLRRLERGIAVEVPPELAPPHGPSDRLRRLAFRSGLPMPERDRLIVARELAAVEFSRIPVDEIAAGSAELRPFLRDTA